MELGLLLVMFVGVDRSGFDVERPETPVADFRFSASESAGGGRPFIPTSVLSTPISPTTYLEDLFSFVFEESEGPLLSTIIAKRRCPGGVVDLLAAISEAPFDSSVGACGTLGDFVFPRFV